MKTVASQRPLASVTLRKYEQPMNLEGWELTKKFCLSLGLLNPGDSRDVIVDILHVILYSPTALTAAEIKDRVESLREKMGRPLNGCAMSNVLRQIRRLKDAMLVEKHLNSYRVSEGESLQQVLTDKVLKYRLEGIISRVREYAATIDERRSR